MQLAKRKVVGSVYVFKNSEDDRLDNNKYSN